ncbi:hypothetical protein PNOK_0227200 [Pyrrhoderma noxium]|uniref:Uncharacterized protein n=1 Tax=Pyrrhoderma noxium TaxID=2282107 RepID=A0A286US71_9AGAM|nr:hypothetical protein PNOK_0227200 [Pyrrhoderma noxium]
MERKSNTRMNEPNERMNWTDELNELKELKLKTLRTDDDTLSLGSHHSRHSFIYPSSHSSPIRPGSQFSCGQFDLKQLKTRTKASLPLPPRYFFYSSQREIRRRVSGHASIPVPIPILISPLTRILDNPALSSVR